MSRVCISIKDQIQVVKLTLAFLQSLTTLSSYFHQETHLTAAVKSISRVHLVSLQSSDSALDLQVIQKQSYTKAFSNVDYELLETCSEQQSIRLAINTGFVATIMIFLRGDLRVVDYPVAFAGPVCKSFLLNRDPFRNHCTLKQSYSSHALQCTITSLTYRAWLFLGLWVLMFHSFIVIRYLEKIGEFGPATWRFFQSHPRFAAPFGIVTF